MDLWKEFSEAATSLFPGVAVNKKNVRCGTMPELGSTPLMSQFLVQCVIFSGEVNKHS